MSKKSCPVALQVEILIVTSPGAAAGKPQRSVLVCDPDNTIVECIPV